MKECPARAEEQGPGTEGVPMMPEVGWLLLALAAVGVLASLHIRGRAPFAPAAYCYILTASRHGLRGSPRSRAWPT
jgi:hypothetical protein